MEIKNPLQRFRKAPEEKALDVSKHEPWLQWIQSMGLGGTSVTHESALKVATVLACVRVVSEDVAKYPLNVYRQVAGGKELATNQRVYTLLRSRPNSWQTSFEWRECMNLHAMLTGNGYSLITRDTRGNPQGLRPLMPGWVEVDSDDRGRPEYTVRPGGNIQGFRVPFERMFHLRGPSWDTVVGMDATQQARKAIGLSMTTEESQSKLHENGVRPSGQITTPNQLGPEALDRLQKMFAHEHAGVSNAFKVPILDFGLEFKPTSMTGVDAQHIETRQHQIQEICRAFKVFPQMVGVSDKATTYASAEAFFAAHHEHTMLPWYSRWEQALDRDVLDKQGPLFARFEINRVLMASLKDQAEYFRTMREIGAMNADEIRETIGRDPRADGGGDEYLKPMNMAGNQDET
jgi:HK97 family phage portal protein